MKIQVFASVGRCPSEIFGKNMIPNQLLVIIFIEILFKYSNINSVVIYILFESLTSPSVNPPTIAATDKHNERYRVIQILRPPSTEISRRVWMKTMTGHQNIVNSKIIYQIWRFQTLK